MGGAGMRMGPIYTSSVYILYKTACTCSRCMEHELQCPQLGATSHKTYAALMSAGEMNPHSIPLRHRWRSPQPGGAPGHHWSPQAGAAGFSEWRRGWEADVMGVALVERENKGLHASLAVSCSAVARLAALAAAHRERRGPQQPVV